MKLPRIFRHRPFGHIVERATRETLGPQAGHNYLYQHTTAAIVSAKRLPTNETTRIIGYPGGTQNLTDVFVIDDSVIGGTSDLIV
jgi:hypothetical protein